METQIAEIAPNIYRLSTYVEDADFMFNQFLVVAEEPLLFQTGLRALFPLVENAVARLMPIEQLRWITFGNSPALTEHEITGPALASMARFRRSPDGVASWGMADARGQPLAEHDFVRSPLQLQGVSNKPLPPEDLSQLGPMVSRHVLVRAPTEWLIRSWDSSSKNGEDGGDAFQVAHRSERTSTN